MNSNVFGFILLSCITFIAIALVVVSYNPVECDGLENIWFETCNDLNDRLLTVSIATIIIVCFVYVIASNLIRKIDDDDKNKD